MCGRVRQEPEPCDGYDFVIIYSVSLGPSMRRKGSLEKLAMMTRPPIHAYTEKS